MRPDRTAVNSSTGEHRPTGGNHQTHSPPAGYWRLVVYDFEEWPVSVEAFETVGADRFEVVD